jgi:hypothetical protein
MERIMQTQVEITDLYDDNPTPLPVDIIHTDHGIELHPKGYECANGGGPIFLEIYEGRLQLHVWADIKQEDPTHTIPLSEASEESEEKRPKIS